MAASRFPLPEFTPSEPESEYMTDPTASTSGPVPISFCAEWNPEFPFNGHRCCTKRALGRKRTARGCASERRKTSYCGEMTESQRAYADGVAEGKIDVLSLITERASRAPEQSYCSVNNGFLAWGRRVVPTPSNRIELRSPGRCVDFGTDAMVGLLEWTGRQIHSAYSRPEHAGVRLIVGDVSAPKGGCLPGRVGRRGHASHTSGQDVDIAFLTVRANSRSIASFHKDFDASSNWWLVKQIFKNPHACVKVIFLDRTLIRKLGKAARNDPEWPLYARYLKHVRGHRNHYHVRIGAGPGKPGCGTLDAALEDEVDAEEADEELFSPDAPQIPVIETKDDATPVPVSAEAGSDRISGSRSAPIPAKAR